MEQSSALVEPPASSDILGDTGHEPILEELQQELPVVFDGQIPLGDLLSRVVQSIYAELSELAETLPNMSDSARKRSLADWVVKTKKQVVKLYAVVKWSRDANTVQKCMNIVAFLLNQNEQFGNVVDQLKAIKDRLDGARVRNHDVLTSLDVLTKGSYLRLPTCIKKLAIPITPLTDEEVDKTFLDMEEVIRYRLRMTEIVPIEMSNYTIAGGRVHFVVSKLFKTSVCLLGGSPTDGWFFGDVEFLISVGGDLTGLQEFPRKPPQIMRPHITDAANIHLQLYVPPPVEHSIPLEATTGRQIPKNVIDAPLVRLFNFLQTMSLSYQLEILWYQAERMRALGWADYLSVQISKDRKHLKAVYWIRSPVSNFAHHRPRIKVPNQGGVLTISIIKKTRPVRTSGQLALARLQHKSKLGNRKPSDEVEGLEFQVSWEPANGALGVIISPEASILLPDVLKVEADNLDFEEMLLSVIKHHSKAILASYCDQLQQPSNKVFSAPGVVAPVIDGQTQALRIHLGGDEVAILSIDNRTGKFNLKDTGDLAATGRAPRFAMITDRINEVPTLFADLLPRLRLVTILDTMQQKASYLGLESFRTRNILPNEMIKLGPDCRGTLYIRLAHFPDHYLVLVVTDDRFRYALITTKQVKNLIYTTSVLEDIAWLNFNRIHLALDAPSEHEYKHWNQETDNVIGFDLDTPALRELYSYCCARVAFMNVERQFKLRGIPFTHVKSSNVGLAQVLAQVQSSLARSVPALCVQSKDILSGAPAAEAAMPNIRVIPLNWWSHKKAQVVTCVKLKYVQQPMGKTAGNTIIRPSKRIIYDTKEAVVSFLSENVMTCVDEFLEEWARVSKMVVIAREVAQMAKQSKWHGVRLLSFDLQTVEFAYAQDYTVSITCLDQLSPSGGTFDLYFSRLPQLDATETDDFNPHEDAEPFLRDILRRGHGRLSQSLHTLVTLLRETLPIVVELDNIRRVAEGQGRNIDVFAKAAGWYRLSYGGKKYGLDFRLMTAQRIAILDASHSVFAVRNPSVDTTVDPLVLQPIPNFADIVSQVVRDGLFSGDLTAGKVAALEIGVICDTLSLNSIAKSVHTHIITPSAS